MNQKYGWILAKWDGVKKFQTMIFGMKLSKITILLGRIYVFNTYDQDKFWGIGISTQDLEIGLPLLQGGRGMNEWGPSKYKDGVNVLIPVGWFITDV